MNLFKRLLWSVPVGLSIVVACSALFAKDLDANDKPRPEEQTDSQKVLSKVMNDIRRCDKTVRYEYDDKTGQINPPELRKIEGLQLDKLRNGLAVFRIDEKYEGLHASTLTIGRPKAGNRWSIHAVAFSGDFQDVRRRLESLWHLRFKDMLRPGPDVIYDGKYAQVEMLVDKKRRFLSIEKMPPDVYPYISQPDVGCNHVDN